MIQKSVADILKPWQAVGPPPPPGGVGPECPRCGLGRWIELGGGKAERSYHPNLDIEFSPNVDILCDLSQGHLPFEDGHAERIKAVHVLNHLSATAGRQILRECYRVLEPGGSLYVMVTDLAFVFERILEEGFLDCWVSCIFGDDGSGPDANMHHWGFSEESLIQELLDAGFSEIVGSHKYNSWEVGVEAIK